MSTTIVGDPITGRTIRIDEIVNIHFIDKYSHYIDSVEREMEQANWLWVERRDGERIIIHTHTLKLIIVLYESISHGNAALKVIGVQERTANDRTRVVRYGLKLIFETSPFLFTGEYYQMERNMVASDLFRQIQTMALKMDQFQQGNRLDLLESKKRERIEKAWAADLIDMINKQEDKDFAETKTRNFFYHKVESSNRALARGVAYKFYTTFDPQFEYNEIALSDDPFPMTYEGLIAGSVGEIEDEYVELIFPNTFDYGKIPETGYLLIIPNNITYAVQRRTVQDLVEKKTNNTSLLNYLIHHEFKEIKPKRLKLYGDRFLEKQIEAVEKACATEDFLLVQGPPGTGKTTIIVEMVRQLIAKGERVLISSKNNLAVDNVLEQLIDDNIDCIRLGREEKVKVPKVKDVLLDVVAVKLQENIIERCGKDQITIHENLRKKERFLQIVDDVETEINTYQEVYEQYVHHKQIVDKQLKRTNALYWFHGQLEKVIGLVDRIAPSKNWQEQFHQYWSKKRANRLDKNEKYKENLLGMEQTEQSLNKYETFLKENFRDVVDEEDISSWKDREEWDRYRQQTFDKLHGLESQKGISTEWIDELKERQQSLYPLLLRSVQVVGATCIGIDTSPEFKDAEFDTVIIDEAGQITIFDVLVPMSRAKKVILIGDHMQLPPVADQELIRECHDVDLPGEWLEVSLFEQLFYKAPEQNKVMLDTQFRMHPVVASFISKSFYENKYKSGVTEKDRTIDWDLFESSLVFQDTKDMIDKYEQQIHEVDHLVYFNQLEAYLCIRAFIQILKFGRSAKDVGIVTPYKKQKQVIENNLPKFLQKEKFEEGEIKKILSEVEIDTVDSFQGRGKEIILFSFTRSNEEKAIGFLRELRRLNVTMTRCKSLLLLIGDSETLTKTRDKQSRELFTQLVRYVKENGQYMNVKNMIGGGGNEWHEIV